MKPSALPQIQVDGSPYKITIVMSTFYPELSQELLENTQEELIKNGVKTENIKVVKVTGCMEIPYICKRIIGFRTTDVIIALGVIVRGETSHYELVNSTTHTGLMNLQLEAGTTPICFGIIPCENIEQAKERVSKNGLNKGAYFAQTALLQEDIVQNKL